MVLEHIEKLLKDDTLPLLEGELAEMPELRTIHEEIKVLREILLAFSVGDFSRDITMDGAVFESLATLREHMDCLFLQMQMVEQGNLTQQFFPLTSEFSVAFNRMVSRLDSTLSNMKNEEKALQERESRFKYLADHDPLTGALNRRSFMEQALIELKRAAVESVSCGIVMMDIDFFKKFNDTYGHLAGDTALRHLVAVMSLGMRKNDFLGRYGGEEFVFFFSHADKQIGIAIAERLRKTLADSPVLLETGPVPMAASFGVAMAADTETAQSDVIFLERLINNADQALYQAKHAGRNRVVCFEKTLESYEI
jgi:diguanylate cyclase (GGDEF)-like protein